MPLGALAGGALASRVPYREVFVAAGALQLVALLEISARLVPLARSDQQVIDLSESADGGAAKHMTAEDEVAAVIDPVETVGGPAGVTADAGAGDCPPRRGPAGR
jgi:hypothetical protein